MPICLDGGMKIFNKPNTQLFWGEQQGSLLLTLFIVKDDLQKVKFPTPATQNGLGNVIPSWPRWMFCKAFKKHTLFHLCSSWCPIPFASPKKPGQWQCDWPWPFARRLWRTRADLRFWLKNAGARASPRSDEWCDPTEVKIHAWWLEEIHGYPNISMELSLSLNADVSVCA